MFKIRNDDVSYEINLDHFKWFCELCDHYNIPIIQCITPLGISSLRQPDFTDDQIVGLGGKHTIFDNEDLIKYLAERNDEIAIHGLWHTHAVTETDIKMSRILLEQYGLLPEYYVAPFNETYQDQETVCNLKVIPKIQRLEDYHFEGVPTDEIVYLHSWRYDGSYYQKGDLETCLQRITSTMSI